jgi:TetR/AcrR family hemagglutinin/protease transcriptional regulator
MSLTSSEPRATRTAMKIKSARKGASARIPARDARLPPAERRRQLMACAMRIFAEHGLGAANHAMVAAEARVSVPTVFFYFKTREQLIDAVLSEVEHYVGSTFENALQIDRPAHEVLLQLSQTMTKEMDSHPYHVRVFMEWSIAMRDDIWPRYLRFDRRLMNVLTQLLERGQREGHIRPDLVAEDEAQILHAASRVLAHLKMSGAPAARIDRFRHSMFQPLLPALPKRTRPRARPRRLA